MKGNAAVLTALQAIIDLEMTLSLQYQLDAAHMKCYGLSIAGGLRCLSHQSRQFAKMATKKILAFEGEPSISAGEAKTNDAIPDIFTGAIVAEEKIVAACAQFAKVCWDAGDMATFHFFQHLAKWHTTGDNGYKGHLEWLEKQAWQLDELGEQDYVSTKV